MSTGHRFPWRSIAIPSALGAAAFGLTSSARAEGLAARAAPAPASAFALVGDANLGIASDPAAGNWPSLGVLFGARYGFVEGVLLVDYVTQIFDNIEFYGVGLGPIYEWATGYRVSLVAGIGWQRYCAGDCTQVVPEYDAVAFQGRLGVGKAFAAHTNGARLVVDAWLTGVYSSPEPFDGVRAWREGAHEIGGFRPGGALGVGFDWPL